MTIASPAVPDHRQPDHRPPDHRPPDGGPIRCGRALASYLDAVRRELAARRVTAHDPRIYPSGPEQALSVSLELVRPGVGRRVRAGWHEELGWWAEPCGETDRRYLPGALLPPPSVVADFLTLGVTGRRDLGSTAPTLHRYRMLAGEQDLVALLGGPAGGARG